MRKLALAVSATALVATVAIGCTGCASCSRFTKSVNSDWNGGLDRTVTLYDYQGGIVVCEEN